MRAIHPSTLASRNLQKHTNPNPLHRWLLRRFHETIAEFVEEALTDLPTCGQATRSPVVMDVGCGEGFVEAFLRPRLSGARVLGVDARWEALAFAHQRGPAGAAWLSADALRLPFRGGSVPVVLCLEVLEHLPHPWAVLEELKRVTAGSLVLSVPNQPFFALGNLLRGKNLRTLGDDPEHLSHWRGSTFLRLLQKRLTVTRVAYSFPWVVVAGKP